MSDLAEKILAAIEADERVAQEATTGPWTVEEIGSDTAAVNPDIAAYVDCNMEYGEALGDLMRATNARHIVRWQPEAVLRRCAADREIVALHKPDVNDGLCNTCGLDGQNLDCTYPCDTLRIMARGYGLEVEP